MLKHQSEKDNANMLNELPAQLQNCVINSDNKAVTLTCYLLAVLSIDNLIKTSNYDS